MRTLSTVAALIAVSAGLAGQTPAPKAAPPRLDEKPKVKVAGYLTHSIQGFTVLVHADVFGDDAKKLERTPLEVLDVELATIVRVMNAKSVNALRGLVLWVEWDERLAGEVGRGVAVAVYRGGDPEAMAREGLHPLKAKTVNVLSMRALAAEHQPKRDSGRCVLMHEFAHAVHDQLVGWDSPQIKAAYAQAMERKLYDAKTHYAATSPVEFFAELTCCYLDRLHYYPNTRDDLKKHDPATFKLMETVWAGSASKAVAAKGAKPAADLSVRLADIAFGPELGGPKFDPQDAAGKVAVVACWGGYSANLLDRVAGLHSELKDYGLVAVGAYRYNTPEAAVRKDASTRGPDVPVTRGAFYTVAGDEGRVSPEPPETFVFDAAGACVYRGSGFDAAKPVRAAVGAKLLRELTDGELPKAFKPVTDAFAAGTSPLGVLPKLAPLLTSADADTKALAVKLQTRVLAPLRERLATAEFDQKGAPLDSFLAAEKLAAAGKGTPVAAKAAALAEKLRGTPEVAAELKARTLLAPVQKLHAQLSAQEGAGDAATPRFQARHAVALTQLQRLIGDVKAKYPKSHAAKQAEKLGLELGVAE